jgi:hypothetical protein
MFVEFVLKVKHPKNRHLKFITALILLLKGQKDESIYSELKGGLLDG